MEGINESVQIIRLIVDGTSTFVKLGGEFAHFSGHELKKLAVFLAASKKQSEKDLSKLKPGELPIDKLQYVAAENHQTTTLMQINEDLYEDFVKYAEENKMQYARLFDANRVDGKMEIAYRSGQAVSFEAYIASRYPAATTYTYKDYLLNSEPERQIQAEQIIRGMEDSNNLAMLRVHKSNVSDVRDDVDMMEFTIEDDNGKAWYATVPRTSVYISEDKGMEDMLIVQVAPDDSEGKILFQDRSVNSNDAKLSPITKRSFTYSQLVQCAGKPNSRVKDKDMNVVTFTNSLNGSSKTAEIMQDSSDKVKNVAEQVRGAVKRNGSR